jgi:phosphoribosylformylglycinamidine cyclo-ligase
MGCRLEIYTEEKNADQLISIANGFGVDAQVIGRVESGNKQLSIKNGNTEIIYLFN